MNFNNFDDIFFLGLLIIVTGIAMTLLQLN